METPGLNPQHQRWQGVGSMQVIRETGLAAEPVILTVLETEAGGL